MQPCIFSFVLSQPHRRKISAQLSEYLKSESNIPFARGNNTKQLPPVAPLPDLPAPDEAGMRNAPKDAKSLMIQQKTRYGKKRDCSGDGGARPYKKINPAGEPQDLMIRQYLCRYQLNILTRESALKVGYKGEATQKKCTSGGALSLPRCSHELASAFCWLRKSVCLL